MRSMRAGVPTGAAPLMSSRALLISSSDRSHEPALAVTSKQPDLSVTIAIGSSPMLIAFLPGVSGSASSTLKSPPRSLAPPVIFSDGWAFQVAMATVPDDDCRMNEYHVGVGVLRSEEHTS